MKEDYAILVVSHVEEIAEGLKKLLDQITETVEIYAVGGGMAGGIGTNYTKISEQVAEIDAQTILVFYDLGSARMNLRMLEPTIEQTLKIYDVAFVEGAYLAATLLDIDHDLTMVEKQLEKLAIRK